MSDNIIVAIDAMGGDNAPSEIISGCIQALEHDKLQLLIVGDEKIVNQELSKYQYNKSRIKIQHASEVISNEETPTAAIKQKKDSSIVVGLNILKSGQAGAFVSAGSTGALLTGATVIVGRIKGVERPALATMLPNEKGSTFYIDIGANVDAKPSYLLQFAQMGSVYMENIMGIQNPTVGLVNIGAEKEKGNNLTKEAYELLARSGLNFIGNAEARDLPHGIVDIAVCDAFVGNVILKYSEGLVKSLFSMIKKELMSSTISKIGAMFSKQAFINLKNGFDASEVGGAPFLGLNALVVKAHGSSDAKAIRSAIWQSSSFIEKDIVKKIETRMQEKVSEKI